MPHQFPILETPRLILRAIQLSDLVSVRRNLSDSKTLIYSDKNQPPSLEEVERMIRLWEKRFVEKKGIRWGMVIKGDNEIIGSCGYKNFHQEYKTAEIGYEISADYRRQGLMSEALNAIIPFGFDKMQLLCIEATVNSDNFPSISLLKKLGFIETDIEDEYQSHLRSSTNLKLFTLNYSNFNYVNTY